MPVGGCCVPSNDILSVVYFDHTFSIGAETLVCTVDLHSNDGFCWLDVLSFKKVFAIGPIENFIFQSAVLMIGAAISLPISLLTTLKIISAALTP